MDLTAIRDSLETIVVGYSFATSAGVLGYTIYLIRKDYINENKQLRFDFMKNIRKYKTK